MNMRTIRTTLFGLLGLLLSAGGAPAAPAVTPLALNQAVGGLSGPAGSIRYFQVNVPAGVEAVEFATGGGAGNSDLYVQPHTPPTLSAYFARSVQVGPVDRVRISRPRPGAWFVAIHAATNYQGVGLRTRAGGGPAPVPARTLPPPAPARTYRPVPAAPTVPYTTTLRIPPAAPHPLIRGREDLMVMTAPSVGQTFQAGQTIRIAWRVNSAIRRLRVEFSADDGKHYSTYAMPALLDARRGEAYWRIPSGDARFVTSYGRLLIVGLDPIQGTFPAAMTGRIRILPGPRPTPPVARALPRTRLPAPPPVVYRTPPTGYRTPPAVYRTPPAPPVRVYRPRRGVDPYENNDSHLRPSTIRLGQVQTHTIYPDEDDDWILCPIPGPGRYVVQFTHVTVDEIEGEVYQPDSRGKDDELEDFNVDHGDSESVRVHVRHPVPYIKIHVQAEDDDETGAYTIRVLRI